MSALRCSFFPFLLPVLSVVLVCLGCNKSPAPDGQTGGKTAAAQNDSHEQNAPQTEKTPQGISAQTSRKTPGRKTGQQAGQHHTGHHTGLKPFQPPKMVRLDNVTPQGLQEFLAKHKGQVILVDYWATWCQPCKATFPHSVKLARQHAADGLVVVSMCVDYAESRPQALAFLKKQQALLINFFPDDKLDPDTLADAFGIKVFPTYRVYGPDGKLAAEILPPEKAEPKAVPQLLAEKIDAAVRRALGL